MGDVEKSWGKTWKSSSFISSIEALFSLFGLVRSFHWLRLDLVEIRCDEIAWLIVA